MQGVVTWAAAIAILVGAGGAALAHPGHDDTCIVVDNVGVSYPPGTILPFGDVVGCPEEIRWEEIPKTFVKGQPAVRLLPSCAPGEDGEPAADCP